MSVPSWSPSVSRLPWSAARISCSSFFRALTCAAAIFNSVGLLHVLLKVQTSVGQRGSKPVLAHPLFWSSARCRGSIPGLAKGNFVMLPTCSIYQDPLGFCRRHNTVSHCTTSVLRQILCKCFARSQSRSETPPSNPSVPIPSTVGASLSRCRAASSSSSYHLAEVSVPPEVGPLVPRGGTSA